MPPDKQAAEYAQAGRDYLAQGLLPEAEQEFQAAITADSGAPAGHTGLARVREQSGDLARPATKPTPASASTPRSTPTSSSPASTCKPTISPHSAQDVQSALRLEPSNPDANGMRQALRSRGQNI